MKFEAYEFDVTRLWDAGETTNTAADQPETVGGRETSRLLNAKVFAFPTRAPPITVDTSSCRRRTRSELRSIAMSLRSRDNLRRSWIADRCGACGKCPDMAG